MSFQPSNPVFGFEFIFRTCFLDTSATSIHHPTNACWSFYKLSALGTQLWKGQMQIFSPKIHSLVGKRNIKEIITNWFCDNIKDYWSEIGCYPPYKLCKSTRYYCLMDVGRRLETSGPETKDSQHSKRLESVPFALGSHAGDTMGWNRCYTHSGLHHSRGTQFRESTAFIASSKQDCSLSGEHCYISQGYQLYKQRWEMAKGTVRALYPGIPRKVFKGARGPQRTTSSNKDIKDKK